MGKHTKTPEVLSVHENPHPALSSRHLEIVTTQSVDVIENHSGEDLDDDPSLHSTNSTPEKESIDNLKAQSPDIRKEDGSKDDNGSGANRVESTSASTSVKERIKSFQQVSF